MRNDGVRSWDNEPLYSLTNSIGDPGELDGAHPAIAVLDLGERRPIKGGCSGQLDLSEARSPSGFSDPAAQRPGVKISHCSI